MSELSYNYVRQVVVQACYTVVRQVVIQACYTVVKQFVIQACYTVVRQLVIQACYTIPSVAKTLGGGSVFMKVRKDVQRSCQVR